MKGVGLGVLAGPGSWSQATVCQGQCRPRLCACLQGDHSLQVHGVDGVRALGEATGMLGCCCLGSEAESVGSKPGAPPPGKAFSPWGRSPRGTPPGAQAGCSPTQMGWGWAGSPLLGRSAGALCCLGLACC